MKKEEFTNMVQKIGTCADDVERRTLLAQLQDDVSKDYDEISRLTESVNTLQTRNNQLLETNLDLFLKIGSKSQPDEQPIKKEEQKQPRKYEDLFNEKGELK